MSDTVIKRTEKEIHETSELLGYKDKENMNEDDIWNSLLEIREVVKKDKKPKFRCKIFGHNGPVLAQKIKGLICAQVFTIGICKRCGTIYLNSWEVEV